MLGGSPPGEQTEAPDDRPKSLTEPAGKRMRTPTQLARRNGAPLDRPMVTSGRAQVGKKEATDGRPQSPPTRYSSIRVGRVEMK